MYGTVACVKLGVKVLLPHMLVHSGEKGPISS